MKAAVKICILGTASLFALTDAALAQTNEQARPSGVGVDDIVVTAQKREERLQDVPISVTAVGGRQLEQLGAVDLAGISRAVPGVHIGAFANQPFSSEFNIRGVGVIEPDAFAGNSVSIVIDGVPQFFNYGAVVDLFDVERIEVLKGPQGTLFGANTTGGAVNIVNRRPGDTFGGYVSGSYSTLAEKTGIFSLGAAVDLPIASGLTSRISAFHYDRNGWIKNVESPDDKVGRQNKTLIRGQLRYESGAFDATLMAEYGQIRQNGQFGVAGGSPGDLNVPAGEAPITAAETLYRPPGTTAPYNPLIQDAPNVCPADAQLTCSVPRDPVTAYDITQPNFARLKNYRTTYTMNLADTPIGDLTSITGYKHYRFLEYQDLDGSVVQFNRGRNGSEGWQFTQELRTSAKLLDTLNLIAGVYYIDDHYETWRSGQYGAGVFNQQTGQRQNNWSASAFANIFWDVTDQLQLIGGARYSHEKTKGDTYNRNFLHTSGLGVYPFCGTICSGYEQNAPAGVTLLDDTGTVSGTDSWNNVAWKAGINYKPTRDVLAYASVSRGFKSGGFTLRIGVPQDIGPYQPEFVTTYEVGAKTEWLDGRLRINAALFMSDYKDIQLAASYIFTDAAGNNRNGTTIQNAASATIKGFEWETVAKPSDNTTIGFSGTHLDAKYKSFNFILSELGDQDPVTPGIQPFVRNLKGVTLQNAPKWAYTVFGEVRFPVASGTMTMRADYAYTGRKLQTIIPYARSFVQATHYVNTNIDWKPNGDKFTVGLYVRNLLDKRYFSNAFSQNGFGALYSYADPREIGMTLRANF